MKNTEILIILLILAVFTACTEKMDINLDETYTRLVVEARLSTDTTVHKVILSKTSSYFYNKPAPTVSGAIVSIDDGLNTIVFNENPSHPGVYETASNVYGVIGKTYHLHIKNVDINNDGALEEYTSTSTIYPINKIDSINMEYKDERPKGYQVKVYVWDPPTEDFYLFNIYKNNVLQTDTITEPFVTDDRLYNGNYTNGIAVGYLRDIKSGERAYPGDTIQLEIWRITKDFYNFMFDLRDATRTSTPLFSGPAANVKGNISNGAVGYFATYSITRAKNVIR
jgi:hypothetical protein